MSPALAVAHTRRNSNSTIATGTVTTTHAASARLGQSLRQASSAHLIFTGANDNGDSDAKEQQQQQHKKRESKTHDESETTAAADTNDDGQGELKSA
jgi:hypothetical protein